MLLEQKGKQEQVDVCVSNLFSFVTTPNNGIVHVEKVKKNVH